MNPEDRFSLVMAPIIFIIKFNVSQFYLVMKWVKRRVVIPVKTPFIFFDKTFCSDA